MVCSVPTVCHKYGGALTWWWCSEDSLFQDSQVKVGDLGTNTRGFLRGRERVTHMWTPWFHMTLPYQTWLLCLGSPELRMKGRGCFHYNSPSLWHYHQQKLTKTQQPSLNSLLSFTKLATTIQKSAALCSFCCWVRPLLGHTHFTTL